MAQRPYGPYDDLTPEQRETKIHATWVHAMAWMAVALVMFWVQRQFFDGLGRVHILDIVWSLLLLGALIRGIVLIARIIALQSPNPKLRKPTDE